MTFGQLLMMAPMLLVYLGGIILSAIWWRRAPRASMLALCGLAMMFLVTVLGMIVQNWIILNRGTVASIGPTLSAFAFIRGLLHAAGLALLIAAAFVGRPRTQTGGFDLTLQPV
jgi:hypothetical protein